MFLRVESLVSEANARAGAGAGESYDFLHPLEFLVKELESEARLSRTGRRITASALTLSLQTQVAASRKRDLTERIPVDAPVFLVGLPRAGSVLLHRLLALHPQVRAPRLWELRNPVGERGNVDALVKETEWFAQEYYRIAPEMRTIYQFTATTPDECHLLLRHSFQTLLYLVGYRLPRYADWLAERDLTAAYEFHKVLLQNILRRVPGERLVLRSGEHLWHLDALRNVYPDARIIRLHRDPAEVIGSLADLSVVARRQRSDDVDPHEVGRVWQREIDRALAVESALPTLDVRHADLQSSPLEVLAAVCEFAGLGWSGEFARRVRAHLAARSSQVRRHQLVDFGLDEAELALSWSGYRRRYGV